LKDFEKKEKEVKQEKKIVTIKIRNEFLNLIDKVNKENYNNLQQDMINIYNVLTDLTDDDFNSKNVNMNDKNSIRDSRDTTNNKSNLKKLDNKGISIQTNSTNSTNQSYQSNPTNNSSKLKTPDIKKVTYENLSNSPLIPSDYKNNVLNGNVKKDNSNSKDNTGYQNNISYQSNQPEKYSKENFTEKRYIADNTKDIKDYNKSTEDSLHSKHPKSNDLPHFDHLNNTDKLKSVSGINNNYDSSNNTKKYNFRKIEDITSQQISNLQSGHPTIQPPIINNNSLNKTNPQQGNNQQANPKNTGNFNYFNKFVNK